MNENSSGNRGLERLRDWARGRDLRGPIAMGAVGAVVVGSLSIVGIAYAQSGGGALFGAPEPSSSKTAIDEPKRDDSEIVEPSKTPEPEPSKTKPAKEDDSKDDGKDDPKESDKPSAKPSDKPDEKDDDKEGEGGPYQDWTPETLAQILAAANQFRVDHGLPKFKALIDNCEKVDYAWADALPGGRISTNIIAENEGPLLRTAASPAFVAAEAYWTDDGKKGGIPAVKIKIFVCVPKSSPSPSPSPSETGEGGDGGEEVPEGGEE